MPRSHFAEGSPEPYPGLSPSEEDSDSRERGLEVIAVEQRVYHAFGAVSTAMKEFDRLSRELAASPEGRTSEGRAALERLQKLYAQSAAKLSKNLEKPGTFNAYGPSWEYHRRRVLWKSLFGALILTGALQAREYAKEWFGSSSETPPAPDTSVQTVPSAAEAPSPLPTAEPSVPPAPSTSATVEKPEPPVEQTPPSAPSHASPFKASPSRSSAPEIYEASPVKKTPPPPDVYGAHPSKPTIYE